MKIPDRQFTTTHAEPGARPLWIGLFGPSGGGKTFSALRLANGIQSVIGGRINFIDTESGRGLHYADLFDYDHTPFPPPHGSLDYLAAITHAVRKQRASIVIVDSLSHEHDGEGGMIEFQEAEIERLAGGEDWKREKMKMLAWTKPKAARKALLRGMLAFGTDAVFILCFRADEQSKPVKKADANGREKTEVVQMGFMPIAGKPFVYEATVCALLMPGASGVPTWNPENVGEKLMRKLPEQFREMFAKTEGKPMSEEHGRLLAEWAKGASPSPATAKTVGKAGMSIEQRADLVLSALRSAPSVHQAEATWERAAKVRAELLSHPDASLLENLTLTYESRLVELREVK